MGRFFIRFFHKESEVDWTHFDYKTLDTLLDFIVDICGPTYHSERYYDIFEYGDELCLGYYLRDQQLPLPKDLVTKTIEFGWGKNRKDLRLIGDRIPIDDEVKFQVTYV